MGNSIHLKANQTKFFRSGVCENFAGDPSAFRVFVKKRNKFIPGWLKINDEEILFSRGGNNIQFWPLAYLRRYGYTCSGIFFFESGRRCASGEGLHTFQSHHAERIFHMVQSKIKIEEYARGNSRASSVVSTRANAVNPQIQTAANALPINNRIHPVQRFSSEGANHRAFLLNTPASGSAVSSMTNGYSGYNNSPAGYQTPTRPLHPRSVFESEALYRHRRYPPPIPTGASSLSVSGAAVGNPFTGKHPYQVDRPRSVVSALEHGCSSRKNSLFPSSASTIGEGNYSSSGSSLMNRSYNSALGSYGNFSSLLWGGNDDFVDSQQLQGDIVMEHILSNSQYRLNNLTPNQSSSNGNSSQNRFNQQQQQIAMASAIVHNFFQQQAQKQKYHSYMNVELPNLNSSAAAAAAAQIRELHRTTKSRQDFLSSQPGGFVFNQNHLSTTSISTRAPSVASSVATTTTILPPLSPPDSGSTNKAFVPYFKQKFPPDEELIMSRSAFSALPTQNKETKSFSLTSNSNKRNYITVAVGLQEEKKLREQEQQKISMNNNSKSSSKLNYALIDIEKMKNPKISKPSENNNNNFTPNKN